MRVFAEKFLEAPVVQPILPVGEWSWTPHNKDVAEIYASGGKTATQASTYAAETDNNADTDRPNEGP